jgi:3alpha(or 20beta)-hydroxysteroid dehydrogenase
MSKLDGKVALVTGAARGQGEAIARRFVDEGAKVVLGDVLDDEGKRVAADIGDAAVYIRHDVTDPGSWSNAVDRTVRTFGSLNVLINNAGILRPRPFESMSLDDYMAQIQVNQVGCFLGMQAVVSPMRDAGGGVIVNTSSTAGLEGMPGLGAYSASKFAIRGMTRTAAIEFGPYGIRVNAVCPGGIDTAMTRLPEFEGVDSSQFYAHLPIPRVGRPDEVASMMVFLASDESSYCTGTEFVIDGGSLAGTPLPTQ